MILLALDARRLQLIAVGLLVAAPSAVAVVLASRADGLTRIGSTILQAEHDGHRLATWVLVLAGVSAVLGLVAGLAERHIPVPSPVRLAFGALVVLALAAAVGGTIVHYGSPESIARRAYHSFAGTPVSVGTGASLNNRLLNLSNDGRIELWHLAWRDAVAHPVLGSGAGTYEQYYDQHRSTTAVVRDAHNLYLQTLAELGPVGLGLLVIALALPLVAAVRARRHPFVPVAAAAYLAVVIHAAGDWDWQMPALMLAALLCAVAVLAAARQEDGATGVVPGGMRGAALAVTVCVSAFALLGLLGNRDLASSSDALATHLYGDAAAAARSASRWAPWSSQPKAALGDAQYLAGNHRAARVSYLAAVAKDRHNAVLWFDLAVASTGKARTRAAREALRLDPLYPEIAADPAFYGLPKRR